MISHKVNIIGDSLMVLIECFSCIHGSIFREYFEDRAVCFIPSSPPLEAKESTAYKSVHECYRDLKEVICPDEDWESLGGSEEFQVIHVMIDNYSCGEIWGAVCSGLYYSKDLECWKLLGSLLNQLRLKTGGEFGWDN